MKLEKLMPRVIALLEFDAASYDLSARYSKRASSTKTFRAKERERRQMIKRIDAALAAHAAGGEG